MTKLFQNSKCFFFAGKCSLDFGCVASLGGTYKVTQHDGSFTQITGRTGDLYNPRTRFENIEISYDCFIPGKRFFMDYEKLCEWLMSHDGYCELRDGAHPEYYRKAVFTGSIEPSVNKNGGSFTLSFTCDPRKFLVSGSQITSLQKESDAIGSIYNPTLFKSNPLIYVKNAPKSSKINAGEAVITFNDEVTSDSEDCSKWLCIDSEMLNTYQQAVNKNSVVGVNTSADEPYPKLSPGKNSIIFTGGNIENIRIIPNFYRL